VNIVKNNVPEPQLRESQISEQARSAFRLASISDARKVSFYHNRYHGAAAGRWQHLRIPVADVADVYTHGEGISVAVMGVVGPGELRTSRRNLGFKKFTNRYANIHIEFHD
jgi:hypothetical protein